MSNTQTDEKYKTFAEVIEAYDSGIFDKTLDLGELEDLGWFDWFCKDSSLQRKGKTLIQRAKKLAKGGRIDPSKVSFLMKNNCPVEGSLYDDFRFVDVETEKVMYTIIPRREYKRYLGKRRGMAIDKVECELWGQDNDFSGPIVHSTEWKDIVDFFAGVDAEEIMKRETAVGAKEVA